MEYNNDKRNYKSIAKITSLLGSVQVFQILATIIKGKFVAVLLGPVGVGINSLFVQVISLVISLCGFGLGFSGVRDIAQINEQGDSCQLSRTLAIFRRLMYLAALLGALSIIVLSPFISYITFGNWNYIWAFVILSLAVVASQLVSYNATVLQGMRRFKSMAKASLFGSILGLGTSIPLYFFFDVAGIVPAIVLSYVVIWLLNRHYVKKLKLKIEYIQTKQSLTEGRPMIRFGLASMITSFLPAMAMYVINTFISNFGSLTDVGLYAAGTSITTQYVGVVFSAMSTEYYPRLSTVCHDVNSMNRTVNQQAELITFIITPLVMIMMLTAPLLITILLSSEFMAIREFIIFLAFGTFFRAASYTVGFISFAKGDKKFFVYWEGIANSLFILSYNIIGYILGGLNGMAVAFTFGYLTYFILITIVAGRRYHFRFEKSYWLIFSYLFILLLLMLFCMLYLDGIYRYVVGCAVFIITLSYTYIELNKRMGLTVLLKSKFFNVFKK